MHSYRLSGSALCWSYRCVFFCYLPDTARTVVELDPRLRTYQEELRVNCYVCVLEGQTSASVATCTRCGVAMCLRHFKEAQGYSVGGTNYGCPHALVKAASP